MTSSIFWRLLWKEYRTQLSLWLSIATVSIAIQLLAMLWISLEHSPQVLPLYVIAFAMPCFFVLGYAGTTFAVEHELQTYEFLRVLPTRSRIMFVAKALVALASTLCLFLMLWLSAYGMAGGKVHIDSSDSLVFQAAEVGLTAVELFAWGVCFSLIMKQPIKALVFAAIGTIVGRLALVAIVNVDMGDPNRGLDAQTVTVRIVYAGLILLLDLVLAGYWFGEKSVLAEMMRRRAGCRTKHVLPDTVASLTGGRNARTGFLRLAWQELREARWLMAAIGVLALLTLTVLGFRTTMMDGFLGWAAVLICVCGASTFLADHAGNRFRFLTEKGVSPTSVWLSRQLVWLFLALPIGVAAITLAATSHDAANVRSQERLDLLTRQGNWSWWAVLLITSFTVGEFCSPLLRNGIIAWSASIAGVCLFSFWWMLMFVLGVPIWSVAVVPAILLLGSWRNAS